MIIRDIKGNLIEFKNNYKKDSDNYKKILELKGIFIPSKVVDTKQQIISIIKR
jgi:hypothetical protein